VLEDGTLRLTSKGEEILAKLWLTVERAEQALLVDFTTDEVAILMNQFATDSTAVRCLMSGRE